MPNAQRIYVRQDKYAEKLRAIVKFTLIMLMNTDYAIKNM